MLVIESGGLPRAGQDVPAYAPYFLGEPGITFNYRSVPQPGAALYSNGVSFKNYKLFIIQN